jgi:hypothetical protein
MKRIIQFIAERVGFTDYEIVRQNKHVIVDFIAPNGTRVRATIAKTSSDRRALENQIHQLKRLVQQKGY